MCVLLTMCADLRMTVPSRTWYVQEVLFMPALWNHEVHSMAADGAASTAEGLHEGDKGSHHGSCSNPCTDDADDAACGFPEYARVHLALNAWIDPPPK